MYSTKYQRGALSLLWAAVFAGIVAVAAMVALMSVRYERNYFAAAWMRITESDASQNLRQSARSAVSTESMTVRKCTVAGKVVYSNVECDAANPASRKVELQDTRGFEAPKSAPVPSEHKDALPSLQRQLSEKETGR
ncbi:MAG TPA: hypothetical protein VJ654_15085 [Noviherbaspirillum sp.]|nr:hypothetical protein [Noviherbaspirillum sp.]